jgi:hypothetical protein
MQRYLTSEAFLEVVEGNPAIECIVDFLRGHREGIIQGHDQVEVIDVVQGWSFPVWPVEAAGDCGMVVPGVVLTPYRLLMVRVDAVSVQIWAAVADIDLGVTDRFSEPHLVEQAVHLTAGLDGGVAPTSARVSAVLHVALPQSARVVVLVHDVGHVGQAPADPVLYGLTFEVYLARIMLSQHYVLKSVVGAVGGLLLEPLGGISSSSTTRVVFLQHS